VGKLPLGISRQPGRYGEQYKREYTRSAIAPYILISHSG
jgi:hypothetical protein